jgi:hypothetical protein
MLLIICSNVVYSQKLKLDPKIIAMGWEFISPLVVQKIEDPLTKEIVSKTIPKIIKDDIKGAVYEIADATYRVKNVKVLNKAFLAEQDLLVNSAVKALKSKDYAKAVNDVATIVTLSEKYLKSGILDKEDAKSAEIENNKTKANLVKSEEINGKVIIEKNNNYYFFVPNGFVSEIETKDSSMNMFKLNLSGGNGFEIGIIKQEVDDENWSIDYLEKNTEFRDNWTRLVSKNILKEKFGEGTPSPATFVNLPNFKAYKLPYLASAQAAMTTTYLTFHNSTLYLIYFKSPQSEFSSNIKAFEELMTLFYFGESLSFCQIKKMGKVNIINKSANPYDLYKNGELIETIKGKAEISIYIPIGTTNLKAVQKSGFMMYPTENKRVINIKNACQNASIDIGFEDQ